jgi:arginine repressor
MAEVNRSQAIRDYFTANPKATTQEVVDALASHGIVVSATLVRTVKAKHNTRHATKRAATSEATIMDKRPDVSKMQAARDYLKTNKKARNSEVVEALAKQGITITSNYVGNIKSTHNKRRRAKRTVVAKAGIGIPEVKAALAFIKEIGGITAAKKALEVAEEIKKIV